LLLNLIPYIHSYDNIFQINNINLILYNIEMGIPRYFSFIIKKYAKIIKNLETCEKFQHLFMDCNSIIYDSFYDIEKKYNKKSFDISQIETILIQTVIKKIEEYILFISPTKSVYITFDGVAPFAKMSQQRKRRYKSLFLSNLSDTKPIWNTNYITPGTSFMNELNRKIYEFFTNTEKKYKLDNIFISCSDIKGEGEHKIFQHIKSYEMLEDNVAIYGLDSDLIMLSILNKCFCKNIHVFREAPDFKYVVQSNIYDNKEKLFLDIGLLVNYISLEMNGDNDKNQKSYDYILMCFLYGNDFIPSIKSVSVDLDILNKYNKKLLVIDDEKELITINWQNLKEFLKGLVDKEHENLLHFTNNMQNKKKVKIELENVPQIYPYIDNYICIQEKGWEIRYYKALFDLDIVTDEIRKEICMEYLEGIEWTLEYYIKNKNERNWKYNENYGPLLSDIYKYIDDYKYKKGSKLVESGFHIELLKDVKLSMEDEIMFQLNYVLPKDDYKDIEYIWSYCKYFWEALIVNTTKDYK